MIQLGSYNGAATSGINRQPIFNANLCHIEFEPKNNQWQAHYWTTNVSVYPCS